LTVVQFRLQRLADRIVDIFVSTRLMKREYDQVKLHVTVINTRLRKDATGGTGMAARGGHGTGGGFRRHTERESFSASRVLDVSE